MRPMSFGAALLSGLLLVGCGAQPAGSPFEVLGNSVSNDYKQLSGRLQPIGVTSVSASSTRNSFFPASRVIDGNLQTAWGPQADDSNPTLTFDLGREQRISGFAIKLSPGGTSVNVEVWEDGQWVVVESDLRPADATLEWFALPFVNAQRVRLSFTGDSSRLLVCEVQFFGDMIRNGKPKPSPTPFRPIIGPSPRPTMGPSPMPTLPPGTPSPSPSLPPVVPSPTPSPSMPPMVDCGCDVTGGGFVFRNGGRVTFGFVAHHTPALGPTGNIQVVDHASRTRFHGRVNAVTCVDNTATFSGTLRGGGTFMAMVTDVGEPGTEDLFSFRTSTGFSVSGDLGGDGPGGGNIQIHKLDCE